MHLPKVMPGLPREGVESKQKKPSTDLAPWLASKGFSSYISLARTCQGLSKDIFGGKGQLTDQLPGAEDGAGGIWGRKCE